MAVKRQSLAEQLAELSNPRPISYHPDQEDLEDLTAAKVCGFSHEEEAGEREIEAPTSSGSRLGLRRRVKYLDEEDTKYAGKAVSRRDIDAERDGKSSRVYDNYIVCRRLSGPK